MKAKSFILSLIASCMLGMTFVSCSDMLSPDSERHSYEVAGDTLYSYWGILKSLQNVAERYVILNECRGDLVDGTSYLSDSIKSILNYDMTNATDGSNRYLRASDYYHIINSCNAYLAYCDTVRTTGTKTPYMQKEWAQVQAIRAWVYLQLVEVYGEVPFYTEPLLTTDNINNFYNNGDCKKVNADNLATLLAPELEKALNIETLYGFPIYESYGYTTTVCHSTKCMIPVNIILGDLYLTKGDKASCTKAAQYYYNYLGNTQATGNITAGGPLPSGYSYLGYKGEGADNVTYSQFGSGTPFTETGATAKAKEAITAIPSSTNKLWGTVLRGVNDVFGYASEISVHTSAEDTATTASIDLTPQYDKKQLAASTAYFNLCKEQTFEEYRGTSSTAEGDMVLISDPEVGDARQYWVRDVRQTYSNGTSNTEKFITKQNPNGTFTTVYPMIYRKSQIWLRFAEALNRAGYPSFAFAILKNGLCNNDVWLPTLGATDENADYAVRDSAYYYVDIDSNTKDTLVSFPAYDSSIEGGSPYRTKYDLIQALTDKQIVDSVKASCIEWDAIHLENWCSDDCQKVCNYIDKRELDNQPSFLNFGFTSFDGAVTTASYIYRTSLQDRGYNSKSYELSGTSDAITFGIHSRGCGVLKTDERNSVYNYVDMINKKAKENYSKTLTKEEIYNGADDDLVQKCIEDLIVDEEALELAFEGDRFSQLMRVAHRRGDPSYLAKRVAKRNSSLESKLVNEKNWYFPLPVTK